LKYRKFGKLDWEASALGFGAMRLPYLGGDTGRIDELLSIRMIRHAIDHGVNYVDSAYGYHKGNSEVVVGKALRDGCRERVKLATKMPTWLVNSAADMDKCLDQQLGKLQTDHIDFYLLHGLNKDRWPKVRDLGVFEWAEKVKKEGKIRHLGFSFHDDYQLFHKVLEDSDHFTLCQIQYNYMDTEYQAGTKGLKEAAAKGLAVVVMEPIKGGKLAVTPPPQVQSIWDEAKVKRKPAEWALRWVWNHPEVSVVLSGMSEMYHVEENLVYADRSGPNAMEPWELKLISRVKEAYGQLGFVGCTACRYCMPCPQGVEIPDILGLYNEYYMSGQSDEIKKKYLEKIRPEGRADKCIACGRCEEQCPQHLPIRRLMAEIPHVFPKQQ
jgi:predicted aldo/keto reductase-like oxidoreductase